MNLQERYIFLKQVSDVLNKNKVEFWLYYGTLLGIIRDGDFIEYDHDIDISVRREEFNHMLRLEPELRKIGIVGMENREFKNKFVSSHYVVKDGYKIDIYYWFKMGNKRIGFVNNGYVNVISDKCINNLKTIDFKGLKLKVPQNPKKHLIDMYGKDWRIPDKEWKEEQELSLKPINDYIDYLI